MKTPTHWFRLCVDLDPQFQPIGTSYEVRTDENTLSRLTCSVPGPFDRPEEAFLSVLATVTDRHGEQLALF